MSTFILLVRIEYTASSAPGSLLVFITVSRMQLFRPLPPTLCIALVGSNFGTRVSSDLPWASSVKRIFLNKGASGRGAIFPLLGGLLVFVCGRLNGNFIGLSWL